MCENTRQNQVFLEVELQYHYLFLLRMHHPIKNFLKWCSGDYLVYKHAYKIILENIIDPGDSRFVRPYRIYDLKFIKYEYKGRIYEIANGDVLKEYVIFHAHLTRLFAAIYILKEN